MISSVKHFSKESLHLGEQAKALDQVQQLNYQKNFFRFLTSFIFGSFNSIALCASLLYMNYKGETENLTAGNLKYLFNFKVTCKSRMINIFRKCYIFFHPIPTNLLNMGWASGLVSRHSL